MGRRLEAKNCQQQLQNIHDVEILGSGVYLPRMRVDSVSLMDEIKSEKNYGIPASWLSETVGIIERRYVSGDDKPSSMAVKAAEPALSAAGLDVVDQVIYCGIDRDQPEPATAHTVNDILDLKASYAFDVSNACLGFVSAMQLALQSIRLGSIETALIVTGEQPSVFVQDYIEILASGIEKTEARKLLGFLTVGDAAGAIILGRAEFGCGFKDFFVETNSQHRKLCYWRRDSDGTLSGQMKMGHLTYHGKKMANQLTKRIKESPTWQEPDLMLSHNTGRGAFDAHIDLGLAPREKWFKSYDFLGNITTATFPVNYHIALSKSPLKPGELMAGMFNGSGLSFCYFDYVF